ncbi:MAG: glycerophosphoryl diester phosphodiesterase [Oscillospiraceae bacterium]|jgi:glycerophosphoryl diester phosphodiesterase|nr:glycerophosphoryl diester phosphodiesterase [Oscillospiraceae bacterium]
MRNAAVMAHRGASFYAPENTMPAFELAKELGADGIELDVQLTKDGKLVVIHDDEVDRTSNGHGRVSEMSYSELCTLDFSAGKDGYKNTKIPLLEEVFEFASREGIFVNVEIKDDSCAKTFPIADKVIEAEKKYNMTGNVTYSSFNHYILRYLKNISQDIPVSILYVGGFVDIWEYAKKLDCDGIHPHYSALADKNIILECHKLGIKVRPWTVDSEEQMKFALDLGVDSLITNLPDLAKKIMMQK